MPDAILANATARPPFGLWDEAREAEPSHGLFLRVLALNGQTRTASAAFQFDLNGRDLKPDECLELMLRHPLRSTGELIANTPVVTGRSVSLRGHAFRRKDWSIEFRRYCPGCLAESVHHRTWWDLQFMTVCPYHDERLDGGRHDERRVGWSQTDLAWSNDDMLARPVRPRRSPVPLSFEAYVLGRLGLLPAMSAPLLDRYPLRVIVRAVHDLGRLIAGGVRPLAPSVGSTHGTLDPAVVYAAGFRALSRDGDRTRQALLAVRARVPANGGTRSEIPICEMFGWAYALFRNSRNALLGMIAGWMVDIAVEDGRVRRRHSLVADRRQALGRLTLKEACAGLGVHRRWIAGLAARVVPDLGSERSGPRIHLTRSEFEAVGEAIRSALDRDGVARLLGLGSRDIAHLERQGLIARCPGIPKPQGEGARFLRHEILALLSQAEARIDPTHAADVPRVRFRRYARLHRIAPSRLAAEILQGSVVPVGQAPSARGFPALVLATRPGKEASGGLTFGAAAAVLGVLHPTIPALVRAGYLETIPGRGQVARIDEESLRRFSEAHASAKSLAGPLRCSPQHAMPVLRRMGIEPIIEPDGQLTPIVRRADLPSLIRAPAPSRLPKRLEDFWERFRTEAALACPTFKIAQQMPAPQVALWNSRRTARVVVETGNRELTLSMVCPHAAGGGARLRRAVERRPDLERGGFTWLESGLGVELVARYEGFEPCHPKDARAAAEWLAGRLAVIQSVFGRR
jgi:hypothetical protein